MWECRPFYSVHWVEFLECFGLCMSFMISNIFHMFIQNVSTIPLCTSKFGPRR